MQLASLRLKESKFHNQQLYIFNMIQRMKQQAEEIQSIAFKNPKYNAFALLPENVLYSMLRSDDLQVRKNAHKKMKIVVEEVLKCHNTSFEI